MPHAKLGSGNKNVRDSSIMPGPHNLKGKNMQYNTKHRKVWCLKIEGYLIQVGEVMEGNLRKLLKGAKP